MKTDEEVRKLVKSGVWRNQDAQTELLLDIRTHLETIAAQTRKVGRPRKKRGQEPAGE